MNDPYQPPKYTWSTLVRRPNTPLFDRLADNAAQLNNSNKGRDYSQQSARLLSLSTQRHSNSTPSFPRSMRKTGTAEREPLLQDTTSNSITAHKPGTNSHLKAL